MELFYQIGSKGDFFLKVFFRLKQFLRPLSCADSKSLVCASSLVTDQCAQKLENGALSISGGDRPAVLVTLPCLSNPCAIFPETELCSRSRLLHLLLPESSNLTLSHFSDLASSRQVSPVILTEQKLNFGDDLKCRMYFVEHAKFSFIVDNLF